MEGERIHMHEDNLNNSNLASTASSKKNSPIFIVRHFEAEHLTSDLTGG